MLKEKLLANSISVLCFQQMWVYDDMIEQMVQKDVTFVPGLYKIFDEILGEFFSTWQHDKAYSYIY